MLHMYLLLYLQSLPCHLLVMNQGEKLVHYLSAFALQSSKYSFDTQLVVYSFKNSYNVMEGKRGRESCSCSSSEGSDPETIIRKSG